MSGGCILADHRRAARKQLRYRAELHFPVNKSLAKDQPQEHLCHAMNGLPAIESLLERIARRQRWLHAWDAFWRSFLAVATLWLVVLAFYKFLPVPKRSLLYAALLGLLAMLSALLGGWLRRQTLPETARWIDRQLRLKERFATAIEVARVKDSEWPRLVVADAAAHAKTIDPHRLLPLRLPPAARWVALMLLLVAGLGLVPEYRSPKLIQRQRDAENIKATGQHLANVTRHTLEHRPPALEAARQSLENVAALGAHLALRPPSRAEALRELTSAAENLRQQLKSSSSDPAIKRLQQLARSRADAGPAASPEALQKRIQELEQSVGEQADKTDKLARLQEKLDSARRAVAGLQSREDAGAARREQLAQALSALSREAGELGLSLEGLDQAVAALAGDKPGQATAGLDAAFRDLEQLREMAQKLQQLRQQTAQLGRDLAEQLKNGQVTAAKQTLQQMIQQLQSGHIAPEQLDQLLRQVTEAVRPAQDYGKAGERLGRAAQQMRDGDKPGAAASLAQAAEELDSILDQLAEAESLARVMEALQRAQMAIATGQGLGACRNLAMGWDAWTGNQTGESIGSGTNPDNVFGEGDPTLPSGLSPAKVRGEISAAGSMPSITLKGVGIKGASTVQFQEAAAAAQAEAQSALNQDRVPRAYRDAVKNYFDDLKK
jgi:flagellar biosynthesis chaperone FliJ